MENGGRSLIDFVLSSSTNIVNKFEVLKDPLGTSAHTAHKIIRLEIPLQSHSQSSEPVRRIQFKLLTDRKKDRYVSTLSAELESLRTSGYVEIKETFAKVKAEVLGQKPPRPEGPKIRDHNIRRKQNLV